MEKPADIAMQVLRSFLFDRHQWQMYARIWLAMLLLIVALYAGYQFMPEYYYVPLIPVAFLIIAVVRTRKKKKFMAQAASGGPGRLYSEKTCSSCGEIPL